MKIPPMPAPDAESILEKASKWIEEHDESKEENRAILLLFYKGYKIEKPTKREPVAEESKERVEKYTDPFPKGEPLNPLQKAFDNKGKMDELRSQLKEETVSFTQEQYANMVNNVIEIERERDEARAIAERLRAALDECPNGDPLPWKK